MGSYHYAAHPAASASALGALVPPEVATAAARGWRLHPVQPRGKVTVYWRDMDYWSCHRPETLMLVEHKEASMPSTRSIVGDAIPKKESIALRGAA